MQVPDIHTYIVFYVGEKNILKTLNKTYKTFVTSRVFFNITQYEHTRRYDKWFDTKLLRYFSCRIGDETGVNRFRHIRCRGRNKSFEQKYLQREKSHYNYTVWIFSHLWDVS